MKLVFACPSYGPEEPKAIRSQRIAIMHAGKHGHEWLGDASPDKVSYAMSRNLIVNSVIHEDEYEDASIFWCDSDVVLPQDAISTLAGRKLDFVTGIYFQRYEPHYPLIARFDEHGGKDKKGTFNWFAMWPENAIFPVDGCGFGCVLTSVKMLRKMPAPWFEYLKFSEDFDFCLKARKEGFTAYCDSSVLCGHLMDPEEVTIDTYGNFREDLMKDIVKEQQNG